ncbi:hypothetical protein, partial [Yersinia enterocolitica]|uniref:hypothetical protein n=1 Tax=Yersinia enterocolitica TaxID=630 RepID=UPI003D02AF89
KSRSGENESPELADIPPHLFPSHDSLLFNPFRNLNHETLHHIYDVVHPCGLRTAKPFPAGCFRRPSTR